MRGGGERQNAAPFFFGLCKMKMNGYSHGNEYSFSLVGRMSLFEQPNIAAIIPDRKNRILDGAERCFVCNGFHKSTMQDVASECSMSPGNLYRYFPSKDAIVAGLAARDRERFNADFVALLDHPHPALAFIAMGKRHLIDEPRSKTIMMMEIWAEASRNPRMAEICGVMDHSITDCLTRFITHWREVEKLQGEGTAAEVAVLIIAVSDGLFRRRATDGDFDPSIAFNLVLPVIFRMVGASLPDFSRISDMMVMQ
jgi:TetR/AcrR family transcriptional regulator, repressor for uid operon